MKKHYLLFLITFVLNLSNAEAQQKESAFHDFWVQIGSSTSLSVLPALSQTEMQQLFPQNDNLNLPVSQNLYDENKSGNLLASLSFGIKLKNKEKSAYRINPIWRVGIHFYMNDRLLTNELLNITQFNIDTFYNTQGQAVVRADSVITHSSSVRYKTEQIRLESSIIFRTDPAARWSLYTGLGFNFGVSGIAESHLITSTSKNVNLYDVISGRKLGSYPENYAEFQKSLNSEMKNSKTNFSGGIYIPFGIDYQLSEIGSLSKFHVTAEARPCFQWFTIPELRTYTQLSLVSQFGLRYLLN